MITTRVRRAAAMVFTTAMQSIVVVASCAMLTGCVAMTEEEAVALEDEGVALDEQALVTSTTEVDLCGSSCGTWSGWCWDGAISCSPRLACGTNCGDYGECTVNPGSYRQEYRYRTCLDQYGNYSHTEYQYQQGSFLQCGC